MLLNLNIWTGNMDKYECAICMNEYDYGGMHDNHICYFCWPKVSNGALHPVTQTEIKRCVCGLAWNQSCARVGIFGDKNHIPAWIPKK